jgi:hypothetical protein
MKANLVIYNWFYSTGQEGEQFTQARVGNGSIDAIDYHEPMGEGDAHYCDITYTNGKTDRVFNLNSVEFDT